jgi:hypothetical protein
MIQKRSRLRLGLIIALVAAMLIIVSSRKKAKAQYLPPPAYRCCTPYGACVLVAPMVPGFACYCATYEGPIGGLSCY